MDAEVIVIGGGPAGSATAALLAQAGHDVLLLDRAWFPRDKACAEYLSPATADVLDRLGVLSAVEQLGPARPMGMQLVVGGRARALVRYPDGNRQRHALCLPRRELDATLLEHARSRGVRVLEGCQAHAVRADANGAAVNARAVKEPMAELRTYTARLVIGADGSRSVVARSLGLERRVAWPRRLGMVAYYRDVADAARFQERGEMHVGRGVYCGLAPLPGGLVNAGLVVDLGAVGRTNRRSEIFEDGLARLPAAAACLAGAARVGPIRGVAPLARRVARVAGDGFVLVGDAAGFLDPFTGEGVFRALRGAELAAEAVGAALVHGRCTAAALAPYAQRRRHEFAAKEAVCWVIQGLLAAPPLLAYALDRLERRAGAGAILGGVLGDYRPAGEALRPAVLWELLRP